MTENAARTGPILMLAPLGRDAELGCQVLTEAGIACRAGRDLAELDARPAEELSALFVTKELLTREVVVRMIDFLDAQACWSSLPVVLLVEKGDRRAAGSAADHLTSLGERPGVLLLERPMSMATFVSAARVALHDRKRQFQLRDELEARERAEARAGTLAGEMKHRVKNAFAVAISIASQTFRQARTLEGAREAFTGRLSSMARAQDLIGEDGADRLDFRHLVERAIEPYRTSGEPEPFHLEGPSVAITGQKASAFAMAFHELATNAAKYGALSAGSGRIAIHWLVQENSDGRALIVEWRESGGPTVAPPERRGFGSRLLEQVLTHDLGGSTELVFDPQGVACVIRAAVGQDER